MTKTHSAIERKLKDTRHDSAAKVSCVLVKYTLQRSHEQNQYRKYPWRIRRAPKIHRRVFVCLYNNKQTKSLEHIASIEIPCISQSHYHHHQQQRHPRWQPHLLYIEQLAKRLLCVPSTRDRAFTLCGRNYNQSQFVRQILHENNLCKECALCACYCVCVCVSQHTPNVWFLEHKHRITPGNVRTIVIENHPPNHPPPIRNAAISHPFPSCSPTQQLALHVSLIPHNERCNGARKNLHTL